MSKCVMTAREFVNKAKDVAENYPTLYIMGCFGAPMNDKNKDRYTQNHEYNRQATRTAMIRAASPDTFGFDCIGLIKGLLWGWNGDLSDNYGGAKYAANGVTDLGADGTITICAGISTDFTSITIGEAVWMSGHIGIYIGDGLVVESSPAWENGVQITSCNCKIPGYNRRNWTKHGKLPYIDYSEFEPKPKTLGELAADDTLFYMPSMKKGNSGAAVAMVQGLASYYGGKPGEIDGDYGDKTAAAVKVMQGKVGAEKDGEFGPETAAKAAPWLMVTVPEATLPDTSEITADENT